MHRFFQYEASSETSESISNLGFGGSLSHPETALSSDSIRLASPYHHDFAGPVRSWIASLKLPEVLRDNIRRTMTPVFRPGDICKLCRSTLAAYTRTNNCK